MTYLRFVDTATYADALTFIGRAALADPQGAVRLVARGEVLALYVGVLAGTGLMGDGTVLGLRVAALVAAADLDVTTPLTALAAGFEPGDGVSFLVPSEVVHPSWAALTPPRRGWEHRGDLTGDQLVGVAEAGIGEVVAGAPAGSGASAVAALRRQVWSRASATTPAIPAGMAYAAYALGFVRRSEPGQVWATGRWHRLTTPRGHVLAR